MSHSRTIYFVARANDEEKYTKTAGPSLRSTLGISFLVRRKDEGFVKKRWRGAQYEATSSNRSLEERKRDAVAGESAPSAEDPAIPIIVVIIVVS